MVSAMEPVLGPDRLQALVERLDDPQVASSLHVLLDHADLLAVLVAGLDSMVSRGDTIADSLAAGVREVGSVAEVDMEQLVELVRSLGTLAPLLRDGLPVLRAGLPVLRGLAQPHVADALTAAATAVDRGAAEAARTQPRVGGLMALLRALKDDDVSRALGFVVSVARAFGQELGRSGSGT